MNKNKIHFKPLGPIYITLYPLRLSGPAFSSDLSIKHPVENYYLRNLAERKLHRSEYKTTETP